jgi:CBS domain containing-hemolysin-like protein
LRDAVAAKEGGRVDTLMHPRVCYVHEDFSLRQVLQAFVHTGQYMVVVINSFEEPVGVITLGHLLAQLMGEQDETGFDAYENRTAVAAYRLETSEPAPTPSPEPTEVVE